MPLALCLSVLGKWYPWGCALIANNRGFEIVFNYSSEFILSIETLYFLRKWLLPRLSAKCLPLSPIIPWKRFLFHLSECNIWLKKKKKKTTLYGLWILPVCCNVRGFISLILWWESNLQFEFELQKTSHWARRVMPCSFLFRSVKHPSWMQKLGSLFQSQYHVGYLDTKMWRETKEF